MRHKWQPIETAPKDGARILICTNGVIDLTRWGTVFIGYEDKDITGWILDECEDPWYNYVLDDPLPTHWMPLPKPPKEGE